MKPYEQTFSCALTVAICSFQLAASGIFASRSIMAQKFRNFLGPKKGKGRMVIKRPASLKTTSWKKILMFEAVEMFLREVSDENRLTGKELCQKF